MSRFGFSKKANNLNEPIITAPVPTGRFGFAKKIQEEDTSDTSLFEVEQYDSDAVGIDAWAQDSGRLSSLSKYMISRFGKEDGTKKEEETRCVSLSTFLAEACVFQENTPRKIRYAFLSPFLARAFVFQDNAPRKISYASLIAFLAGAFVF